MSSQQNSPTGGFFHSLWAKHLKYAVSSAHFHKLSLYVPSLMQCRHRGKHHTKKPRVKHLDRRVFETITEPLYLTKPGSSVDNCSVLKKATLHPVEEEHAYEKFLIRQCRKVFEENAMLVVFMSFKLSGEDMRLLRNKMACHDIKFKIFSNWIMQQSVEGTKWQNLANLFTSRNVYMFSKEPRVAELVKATKKIPDIHMLGGVLNNQLFSRDELLRYAALPPLDMLLGETVSIMNSAAGRTRSLLSSHQQQLSTNLSQYIKDHTDGDNAATKDS